MSKKDEAIKQLHGMVVGAEWLSDSMVQALSVAIEALSADVVEVGKPYPREEFEKYGLTEWKDKHGQRWVMVERRKHE